MHEVWRILKLYQEYEKARFKYESLINDKGKKKEAEKILPYLKTQVNQFHNDIFAAYHLIRDVAVQIIPI
ncbi:hypothetical protein D5R81_18485 [Parashewanella spongiae]|uniref:Uncharacterized protein n=1 Tax=Parashewanella spongiae TaxID=342950 RepID=A0A3A6TLS8_9GAMM|nr:hypothetical protein D5R81_18485 [Parashewanella spongiae]